MLAREGRRYGERGVGGGSDRGPCSGLGLIISGEQNMRRTSMGITVRKIGHVGILVADVQRSLDFYTDVMGFTGDEPAQGWGRRSGGGVHAI